MRRLGVTQRGVRIAVLGCGLIGESWAALFLAHGHTVDAWDPDAERRTQFAERLERPLSQLTELGLRERGQLTVHETLADAVYQADLVQENAPEKIPVKRALYKEVEAAAPTHAVIASSTSALTWSDLSPEMANPGRLITAHPFNPPHLVPLVELYGLDGAVLDRAEAVYRSVGRKPVRLKKDAVGHIANRLSSALWREAVHMVAEGIADVTAIDDALVHGPGLRWSAIGSHMTYHLGGGQGGIAHYLDHLGASQERRWATLGSPSLTPEVRALLVEGITEEAAGRSVSELEAERDVLLIRVLKARKGEENV
jgi:3-hydroxyacyl-CoA dehydrogenase